MDSYLSLAFRGRKTADSKKDGNPTEGSGVALFSAVCFHPGQFFTFFTLMVVRLLPPLSVLIYAPGDEQLVNAAAAAAADSALGSRL